MNQSEQVIVFSKRSYGKTPPKNRFCSVCHSPIEIGDLIARVYIHSGTCFTCKSCYEQKQSHSIEFNHVEKTPLRKDVLLIYIDGVLVPQLKRLLHGPKGEIPLKSTPDPNGSLKWRKYEALLNDKSS